MNWMEEVLKRKDDLLQDLKGLLSIESVKDASTSEPGKPMGQNVARALDYVLDMSRRDGYRVTNLDGYVGYAEYGESTSGEYVAALCHVDVVPATGHWTTPPFSPDIREGKLFARGAIDDKGPTLAAYYGLKIVKELGLPLKHNVRVIFGADEESGMECMKTYTKREKMPLYGFAPDADFPITHAEKGQINTRFLLKPDGNSASERQEGQLELVSFHGGGVENMVPESAAATISGESAALAELAAKFESYYTEQQLKGSSEVNGNQMTLSLKGKSAHGMEPHQGINAALKLFGFLRSYSFQADADRYIRCVDAYLTDDHLGIKLGIAYEDDITGPLTVNAGIFEFGADKQPFFHLNIRFPVTQDLPTILDTLAAKMDAFGFLVEEPDLKEPHHVDAEHPMIKVLQKIYAEETQLEPTLLTTGGGTYAAFMEYGVAFGALFPGREEMAHRVDEYIEIEDLLKATAIYARAIYELANLDA